MEDRQSDSYSQKGNSYKTCYNSGSVWYSTSEFRSQMWQDPSCSTGSENKEDTKFKALDPSLLFQFRTFAAIYLLENQLLGEDTERVYCMKLWGWSLSQIMRPKDVEILRLWEVCYGEMHIGNGSKETDGYMRFCVDRANSALWNRSPICLRRQRYWIWCLSCFLLFLVQSSLTMYTFFLIGMGTALLCHCMFDILSLFSGFTRDYHNCQKSFWTFEHCMGYRRLVGSLNLDQMHFHHGMTISL